MQRTDSRLLLFPIANELYHPENLAVVANRPGLIISRCRN
jgi:hypothetical protein